MRANVEDRGIKGDYATDGGLLIVSVFLQVLLAMRANVEDRGIKGDCTPLMEDY